MVAEQLKRAIAARNHVGRRGASLLFLALIFIVIGQGYLIHGGELPRVARENLTVALAILPVQVWGGLWVATGLMMILAALWKKFEPIAFGVGTLFSLIWGLSYLTSAILGFGERAYVGAVTYLGVAGFIYLLSGWPEEKRDNL